MARAAFSRLQYDEAAYHFRAAVTLHPRVPGGATNRGRLLLELARAQFRAGRVEDAWNSCEEAARTGRADGDAYLVADAAVAIRGSGPGFWTFTARQNSLCREALAMLGGADPVRETRLRAQLGSTINPWTRPLADPEGASGDGDADRDAESAFLGLQASHTRLLNVAHVLERLALADEAMALGVSSGSDEYLAWGLLWRLGALYQLGRRVELDSDLMSTAAVVDRLKEPLWTYRLLNVRSSLAILDGDYHAADRLSWDALQIAESCGLQEAVFLRCVTTSCLAMLTGTGLDEAEEQIRRLVADAPFFARGWHAELLVALGRMDEAATIWRALAPHLDELPRHSPEWLVAHAGHANLTRAMADRIAAKQLYELLLPYESLTVLASAETPPYGPVALHLGRLASLLGEHAAARDHFQTAVRLSDSMLAAPAAAAARAELATLISRTGKLSAREYEVCRMLAEGLTNREIGSRLQISERTVERHVSHIMQKLDLRTRAGVAVWFALEP